MILWEWSTIIHFIDKTFKQILNCNEDWAPNSTSFGQISPSKFTSPIYFAWSDFPLGIYTAEDASINPKLQSKFERPVICNEVPVLMIHLWFTEIKLLPNIGWETFSSLPIMLSRRLNWESNKPQFNQIPFEFHLTPPYILVLLIHMGSSSLCLLK